MLKDLIGRVFRNNGKDLKRALANRINIYNFRHKGNYVFEADLDVDWLVIAVSTEPMDEDAKNIRVTQIIIYNSASSDL